MNQYAVTETCEQQDMAQTGVGKANSCRRWVGVGGRGQAGCRHCDGQEEPWESEEREGVLSLLCSASASSPALQLQPAYR